MKEKQRKARADAARGKHPKAFGFIERNPRHPAVMDAVRCKLSDSALQVMSEDDRFDVSKTINGKTFIYRRVFLRPTAEYDELTIELDDGSHHVTPVAKSRKKKPFTQDELEAIYMADIEEWARDGMSEELLERYAERTPVRALP